MGTKGENPEHKKQHAGTSLSAGKGDSRQQFQSFPLDSAVLLFLARGGNYKIGRDGKD